jgi:hypothetical protein
MLNAVRRDLPPTAFSPFFNSQRLGYQTQGNEGILVSPFTPIETPPVLPKPSEFLLSTGLGGLGALLLAPLWMKHKIPHATSTSLGKVVDHLTDKTPSVEQSNELVSFLADPAVLLMMIPVIEPRLTRPAIAVTGLLGLGYLGSNALSGLQEVWVRWQESKIRARLVASLDEAYQQSIEAKTQIDEANHRFAEEEILRILKAEGVESPERYLSSNTLDCEPPSTHAKSSEGNLKYTNFVLMPQNPMPLPRQAAESSMPASRRHSPQKKTQDPSVDFKNASRFTLNSIGLGLGLTSTSILLYAFKSVRDFVHAKSQQLQNNPQLNKATIKNTLAPQNTEAVLLHFFQKKEGFVMGGLFIALGVMLKTIQFLTEGLREIEVTRLNAETEKQYETYKLTTLEPHFKAISERLQLEHALTNLKKDLRSKSLSPAEIHQRVQRILDSIGYNWSAPNYYPMAPATQLVPARS